MADAYTDRPSPADIPASTRSDIADLRGAVEVERGRYMAKEGPGENPPVAELLTMLRGAILGAQKAAEEFCSRVSPVLAEPRPTEGVASPPPTAYSSPLARELAEALEEVSRIEHTLARAHGRVEV